MNKATIRRTLAAVGLTAAAVGSARAYDGTATLTQEEKIYGLSLFWREVTYNFANFDLVPELDWDAAYQAHLPDAMAAESTWDYYRVLQRFCALLGDGHTNIFPPAELRRQHGGAPPIHLRAVGRRALVIDVAQRLADRVPIGSEVLAVDGVGVEEFLRDRVLPYLSSSTAHARLDTAVGGWSQEGVGLLLGAPGSIAALRIEKPDGGSDDVSLVRKDREELVSATSWVRDLQKPRFRFQWLDHDIAYVALNTFSDQRIVDDFEQRLEELESAAGLILDLRRNGGGSTGIGGAIAQYLIDEEVLGSTWRTREHIAAFRVWGTMDERMAKYTANDAWHEGEHGSLPPAADRRILVPTAILTSPRTASAAEDFLVYLDTVEHIRTIGEPTNGSTGQPQSLDLPGGGSARICTKRDRFPDGRDFVGRGVVPDVPVPVTLEDLRADVDRPLEVAIEDVFLRMD